MNEAPTSFSGPDAKTPRVTVPGGAQSQAPPPGRRAEKTRWNGLFRWFQQNSFTPRWLPEPLRHPLTGYLVAALLELAAAAIIMLLLLSYFPSFAFRGVLTDVVVVLIALSWGAGPSLFACLVGTFLLYYIVLLPHFSWTLADPADTLGLLMYLVVGVSISLLAGGRERARRQVEKKNLLLAHAEARSRFDYQRLRAVLDVLPSAVLIAGPEGQLLEMNQATRTLWGGDVSLATDVAEYVRYKAWWARTGQPLAPEEWTLARALTSGEARLNDELEIEALDGQRKIILNSAAPIRDETGAIIGGVISALDITEVRRLEQEVTERAAVLQTVFDAITDGIAILDTQGRHVQTNQAFRALFGFEQHPENAVLPLSKRLAAFKIRDEQGQPLAVEAWPAIRLLQGETLMGVDVGIQNLEGRELALNVSGAPIRDVMGHISGCVEVFRDVTERRYLEQHTRDALNALVAMGEAMVQVYQVANHLESVEAEQPSPVEETTLPLVARRLAELTRSVLGCRRVSLAAMDAVTGLLDPVTEVGLSPEQEQAWWASWSPPKRLEERYDAATAAALYAGEMVLLDARKLPERSWDYLFQARTGWMVPMQVGEEFVGILLVDYGQQDHDFSSQEEVALTRTIARLGALVLERDRLLRRWAEARANELALRETKAQMDAFLGIAGHELKSPLTTIKLSLQMTERRLRAFTRRQTETDEGAQSAFERFLEQLTRTMQQVDRLERLVNDLLDVSRVQAGKLDLRPQDTDLATIVRETVEAQRQAAPERTICLRLPEELRVPVFVDPGRIEQAVTNYLTNALKYSPADRPVTVGIHLTKQQARVWVRDEGPGLPTEEQERIWERFHRARGVEVLSGSGVGLGLGLHICRMIVERHHGRVGVESAPGKGSTFWFTLPLRSCADEDQQAL